MVHSQPFRQQAILRFHHVDVAVARELCVHTVAGLARLAVTNPVRQDDEKLRRIERLTFPEKLIRKFRSRDKLRTAAGCPMDDENCIGRLALRILLRLSECPVMETQLR